MKIEKASDDNNIGDNTNNDQNNNSNNNTGNISNNSTSNKNNNINNKDNSTLNTYLPKTGTSNIIFVFIGVTILSVIYFGIRLRIISKC